MAIHQYGVEIKRSANRAGTTPMPDCRTALVAVAKLVAVQQEVTREPGQQVGTVGLIEVFSSARNVVPSLVKLTTEMRDLDVPKLKIIAERIWACADATANATNTRFKCL